MGDQNKTRISSSFPNEEFGRAVEDSAGRRRILIDAEEGPNLDEESYTDIDASPLSPELLSPLHVPRQITPNSSARRQLGPRLQATFDESEIQGTQMGPPPRTISNLSLI